MRKRMALCFLLCFISWTRVFPQALPLTIGADYFGTPDSYASGTSVQTYVDAFTPSSASGFVTSVRMYWSQSGCTDAIKVKFFRWTDSGLTMTAERGPFTPPTNDFSVAMNPAVPVLQGDLIGVTRLTSCGTPGLFSEQNATYYYFPFDVTGTVCTEGCNYAFGSRLAISGVGFSSIDPEIGPDDFRITHVGADGLTTSGAFENAVAYNSTANEFLVVWAQTHAGESDIYGQRIDATSGAVIASAFRISDMGPDASSVYEARHPAVTFNSTNGEYLVVWAGDDDTAPLIDDEMEIFGQRINAANGSEIGTNDFRISNMGVDGNAASGSASFPNVAWNSTNSEYLVVWNGTTDAGQADIYGQRLSATSGAEIGAQLMLSDVTASRAPTAAPVVAYNETNNQYLVVWASDELGSTGLEIFAQRLTNAGAEVGTNDFRVSAMGSEGNPNFYAHDPAVAWSSTANEYLVVWNGTENLGEYEIFGQRISGSTGAQVGSDDFRISTAGRDGETFSDAQLPHVSYSGPGLDEYLVAWEADAGPTDDKREIWAQRLSSAGLEIGSDVQLSGMGPNDNTAYSGASAHIAHSPAIALIVWSGDDNLGTLVDGEFEIFGQLFSVPSAALTSITSNPTVIAADGFSTSLITVQSADGSGNNFARGGATVILSTSAGTLGGVTDHGNGAYTALLTSSATPGTATVTGTIDGVTIADTATVVFQFGPPLNLVATATSNAQVVLSWDAVTGATGYEIHRASVHPTYSFLGSTGSAAFSDGTVAANQTYLYKVRATKPGSTSAFSSLDAATTVAFADSSLNSSTTIKAVHMTQLRTAVNAMRTAAGLAPFGFTDSIVAGVTRVRALHVSQLRAALDEARTALGLSVLGYTDPAVGPSTAIKAVHMTQLRTGTQ